jgi:DNA-binding NarL/FixJ family response regulator
MSFNDVFVGRDRELDLLAEALEHARQGYGSATLISGDAGIGKTTLIREFLRNTNPANEIALTGRCYDRHTPPLYGPWIEIADQFMEFTTVDTRLPVLSMFKPDVSIEGIENQTTLFEKASSSFKELARHKTTILILEDLHWADQGSIEFLRFLARKIASERLLLITTYRSTELSRDHPLYSLLPSLIRESDMLRISLARFRPEEVDAIVRQRYGLNEPEDVSLTQYLQRRAEGNPLFIVELLRMLESEQVLKEAGGHWTAAGLASSGVPSLIQQMTEARLATLPSRVQDALRRASIVGHHVPFDHWEILVDSADLLEAISAATHTHLLTEHDSEYQVAFRHSLMQESIYLSIPVMERRKLHRRFADSLIEKGYEDPDLIAHHLQKAGDERLADWLIKAGERAQRAYAWLTAADRFKSAIQLLGTERSHERGWLLLHVGWILRHSDITEGLDFINQARTLARDSHDQLLEAVATFYLGMLDTHAGDMRRGIETMIEGVDAIDELPWNIPGPPFPWVTKLPSGTLENSTSWFQVFPLRGTVADFLVTVGRYREGKASAESTIAKRELAQTFVAARNRHPTRPDVYLALADSNIMLGDLEIGSQQFDRAVDGYRFAGDYIQVLVSTMYWFMRVGLPYRTEHALELNRRIEIIEECLERARAAMTFQVSPGIARIPMYYLNGYWKELRSEYDNGLGPFSTFWYITLDGWLSHFQGDDEGAWDVVYQVLPEGLLTEPGNQEFQNGASALELAATIALESGDIENARQWLQAHDRWLYWSGCVLGRPESLLLWGRVYLADERPELAAVVLNRALEIAREPRQPRALIGIHRALGELATTMRNVSAAASHLEESLAIADRCNAPFERARTLLALAEMQIAASTGGRYHAAIAEARKIGLQLDARPLLQRISAFANPATTERPQKPYGLTERELHVLRHIVQGMSDREIASALNISRHTVMRHVSSILGKLQVESRTAAAALAVREGLC